MDDAVISSSSSSLSSVFFLDLKQQLTESDSVNTAVNKSIKAS